MLNDIIVNPVADLLDGPGGIIAAIAAIVVVSVAVLSKKLKKK